MRSCYDPYNIVYTTTPLRDASQLNPKLRSMNMLTSCAACSTTNCAIRSSVALPDTNLLSINLIKRLATGEQVVYVRWYRDHDV
jgi:hypothetical protein